MLVSQRYTKRGPFETLGNSLGGSAGKYFDTILGQGTYSVHRNSVYEAAMKGVDFMHSNNEGIRLCKREFLGFVYSSTTQQQQRYVINPGSSATHPVVSRFASSYDLYTILGYAFEYRPTASTYSETGGLGYVAMATQYDSSDEPFASTEAVLNSEYATSCSPADSMVHPVECAPSQNPVSWRFVRHSETDTTEDDRLTDWGVFTLQTGGQGVGGVALGELWVTSDIRFERLKTPEDNGVGRTSVYTASVVAVGTDLEQLLGTTFDSVAPDEYNYGVPLTLGRNLDSSAPTSGRYALEEPGVYRITVSLQMYDVNPSATNDILQVINATDLHNNFGWDTTWRGGGLELIVNTITEDGRTIWKTPIADRWGPNMPIGEGSVTGATCGNSSSTGTTWTNYRANSTFPTSADLTKGVTVDMYVRTLNNFTRSSATLGNGWVAPMQLFGIVTATSTCAFNATFTITKMPSAFFQYPVLNSPFDPTKRLERLERLMEEKDRVTPEYVEPADDHDDDDDTTEVKQALYERLVSATDPSEVCALQRQIRALSTV